MIHLESKEVIRAHCNVTRLLKGVLLCLGTKIKGYQTP